MTKSQLTPRALVIVSVVAVLLCIAAGAAVGLWIGWSVWPVDVTNVDVPDLEPASQEEYIVLTADAYAYDHDLERAKERLAQLNDPQIMQRMSVIAKNYATQNNPAAARIAALVVALGDEDREIALIATTATPTATLTPTATATSTPTLLPPSPTITPTRTATRRPTATRTLAPIPGTIWMPGFPAGWPSSAKYEPVSVAPGQKYWHLVKAIYCDTNDEHDYCKDQPGGPLGTETYIMLVDGKAPISVTSSDGKSLNLEEKAPGDMCNCNYSFQSNGFTIQVLGAPSDKISGLSLYSVKAKLSNWHVRYFLWFQLLTR